MDNKLKFIDDLQEAVLSNRLEEYAAPEDNFQRVRDGWVWYLGMKGIRANELTASDVARMMILFKLARLHTTPGHHDSWVDIAGYAVCGEDIEAGKKEKKEPESQQPMGLKKEYERVVQEPRRLDIFPNVTYNEYNEYDVRY